ncbi:hypothetical protein Tco_0484917 [Tanacetum coccineum]
MSDSEHLRLPTRQHLEDDLDYVVTRSRDYVLGLEARAGTSFLLFSYLCSGAVYTEFLKGDDEEIDDDDDAEDEHLAPAEPAAVAYSADQDPYIAYRVTARMSIRTQAPTPFLSEEIPFPPLPISSPPPISPTYVEGSMGSRAAGIRQRDALPVHETEMPEMCLPLRKRLCRTTPGPGYEVGESSAAGTARQVGPTTARADLYGFTDMLEAAPGRGLIGPFHRRTALLIEEEARLSRAAWEVGWMLTSVSTNLAESQTSEAEAVSRDTKIVKSLKDSDESYRDSGLDLGSCRARATMRRPH